MEDGEHPAPVTAARKHRRGDPYEVGYGKPPKHTRIKKGHAVKRGPPPLKAPDPHAQLAALMRAKVRVKIAGEEIRRSVLEILLQRLRDHAAQGHPAAIREYQVWLAFLPETVLNTSPFETYTIFFRADLERKRADERAARQRRS